MTRHKWKWRGTSGTGTCAKCGLKHAIITGKMGGQVSQWTWPDGRVEVTNKTPKCEVANKTPKCEVAK